MLHIHIYIIVDPPWSEFEGQLKFDTPLVSHPMAIRRQLNGCAGPVSQLTQPPPRVRARHPRRAPAGVSAHTVVCTCDRRACVAAFKRRCSGLCLVVAQWVRQVVGWHRSGALLPTISGGWLAAAPGQFGWRWSRPRRRARHTRV